MVTFPSNFLRRWQWAYGKGPNDAGNRTFYEIPISLISDPSRKHIRQVAPDRRCGQRALRGKEHAMLDIILLALGLGFFALSVGYTIACDRL